MSSQHETFLRQAIELAIENVRSGRGGPFGALVVKDGRVIATGVNQVTTGNDPTAHAEVMAIRTACQAMGSFQLDGCQIYTSCEPCPMCLAAIYWARLDRLVFASTRDEAAGIGFDDALIYDEIAKPVEARRLAARHLPLPQARAAFDAWLAKTDRTRY